MLKNLNKIIDVEKKKGGNTKKGVLEISVMC